MCRTPRAPSAQLQAWQGTPAQTDRPATLAASCLRLSVCAGLPDHPSAQSLPAFVSALSVSALPPASCAKTTVRPDGPRPPAACCLLLPSSEPPIGREMGAARRSVSPHTHIYTPSRACLNTRHYYPSFCLSKCGRPRGGCWLMASLWPATAAAASNTTHRTANIQRCPTRSTLLPFLFTADLRAHAARVQRGSVVPFVPSRCRVGGGCPSRPKRVNPVAFPAIYPADCCAK